MSKFTNFGENKVVDKLRGTEPPYAALGDDTRRRPCDAFAVKRSPGTERPTRMPSTSRSSRWPAPKIAVGR